MGICISKASPEIHEIDYGHENVIYYQDTISDHKIGSLHTHQGSKGFNQDAAIIYQVSFLILLLYLVIII